ncbi:MAG: hypothetical protein AAF639_10775, partial [Chloroflexota bacterium]
PLLDRLHLSAPRFVVSCPRHSPPKFLQILQEARDEIEQAGRIPHDEFWAQLDAEYQDDEDEITTPSLKMDNLPEPLLPVMGAD